MSWLPDSHTVSARRRQLILDYLSGHRGVLMGEIVADLVAHDDTGNASNTLHTMIDWGEIRYEGNARTRRYYPLVRITRSAEECMAIRESNLEAANAARRNSSAETGQVDTGRYVHKQGTNKPNGGQGAIRPRVNINCGSVYA